MIYCRISLPQGLICIFILAPIPIFLCKIFPRFSPLETNPLPRYLLLHCIHDPFQFPMASSSSTAASTSTALNPNRAYDVFINHRGPDVKKTFASFLYRRLLSQGLRVFLDQQELQQGEDLTPQIQDAINTASVHIAIFSPTYCESKWCLDELILMLETLDRGATIIPLFYNVKPSDLRWTREGKGLYVKALHDLENKKTDEGKLRYDSTTIENWRKTLSRLADKSGFELARYNGDEGELLDEVVKKVLKRIKNTELEVAKYPTGLDDKMKDFENTLLLHQSGEAQILGILGLGGLGKTTLAKEFYNRKKSDYPKSCFLLDVRDNATRGSLHQLQRKLMKSLTDEDYQIDSVDKGTAMLRSQLSSVTALVILDDVDHVSQVDALIPVHTVLHSNSLILITSRNRHVLTASRVSSIYNLTELNADHSRELFCLHSFSQPHPLPGFGSLVDKFVEACGGLPLSLIVLGALVYAKDETYWEAQLDKLQKTLPAEIRQRLQISYTALDEEERHMFLDIACFFRKENKDTAIRIWDGSGFNGRLGFDNIQNRCLVNVDSENRIQMHDHIRDLGRDIAKDLLPLRLRRGTKNILQQSSNEQVITEIRGIRMFGDYHDQKRSARWIHHLFGNCVTMYCNMLYNLQYRCHGIRMMTLELLDVKDIGLLEPLFGRVKFPNLVWLRWENYPYTSLPSWISMKNLRVLQVEGPNLETLWQRKSQAPLHLREIEISSRTLRKIPKSIGQLKHLERIVVENGKQVILPEEFCLLQSLKVLVLRYCTEMKTLPECFGNLKNLEHIELDHCRNLKSLSNSFGNLIRPKYLSAVFCESLTISSDTLGNITTLEYIDFSRCYKIEVLPHQVAHQKSLEVLRLSCAELRELQISSIGELSNLEVLLIGSDSLDKLPPSLGDLSSLKLLAIRYCTKLKCLPSSVRRLTQLTELVVVDCPLTELPFETVEGERGTSVSSESPIEQCMPRLQSLTLHGVDISELSFSAGVCPNLQHLSMWNCRSLVEVGTLPNTLRTLNLIGLVNLRKIEGLCGLTKLQRLKITGCKELEELRGNETLISLTELDVRGCGKLKSIRGLGCLTKLQRLYVIKCSGLEELPDVEDVRSLEELHVRRCGKLKSIRGLGCLTKLQRLDVRECSGLEELPDVEDVRSLEELDASDCPKLHGMTE